MVFHDNLVSHFARYENHLARWEISNLAIVSGEPLLAMITNSAGQSSARTLFTMLFHSQTLQQFQILNYSVTPPNTN